MAILPAGKIELEGGGERTMFLVSVASDLLLPARKELHLSPGFPALIFLRRRGSEVICMRSSYINIPDIQGKTSELAPVHSLFLTSTSRLSRISLAHSLYCPRDTGQSRSSMSVRLSMYVEGAGKFRRRMKLRCISAHVCADIPDTVSPQPAADLSILHFSAVVTRTLIPCVRFLISTPAWGSGLAHSFRVRRRQRVAGWQHQSPCSLQRSISEHTIMWECRNVAERSNAPDRKIFFRFTRLFNCGFSSFSYRFTIRLNRLSPSFVSLRHPHGCLGFKNSLRQASNWMPVVLTFSYVSVLQTDISIVFAARPDGPGIRQAG